MIEQNTDRITGALGALIVGALIISVVLAAVPGLWESIIAKFNSFLDNAVITETAMIMLKSYLM